MKEAELLLQLIDERARLGRTPSGEIEAVTGIVAPGSVAAGTRTYAAFLEGAKTPTPGIPYVAGAVPRDGDRVVVLRQRRDGWLLGSFVLGRDLDLAAYPKVIASGQLIVPQIAAPGVSTRQVTINTGLTYVPAIEAYLALAGQALKLPSTLFNAAGQVLAIITIATEVISTTQTRITVSAQTAQATGGGPWAVSWQLLDRQAI